MHVTHRYSDDSFSRRSKPIVDHDDGAAHNTPPRLEKATMNRLYTTLFSLVAMIPIACGLAAPRLAPVTASVQRGSSAVTDHGSSRRSFLVAAASSASFSACQQAAAYEFVDVGGGQGSAETKAMNIQAYETNNRLEKGGFQLDSPDTQRLALTEALSGYSYEPEPNKTKNNSSSNSNKSSRRNNSSSRQTLK